MKRRKPPLEKRLPLDVARLANMGLRAGTLGTRFIFIFFLAKYVDPASVGHYGLFTATIGYCLYFVGLDFYVYVTREIIRVEPGQQGRLLKAQAALSGLLYLAVLPASVAILSRAGWPGGLVWWFVPILLLEHFNQEVFRLLVALSQQISASVLLFIRQGSWAIAAVVLMGLDAGSRSLDVVMALWACAGAVAAATGAMKLHRLRMGGWKDPIDWRWVRKGIVVCVSFLVATLALRGMQTVDRYWMEALAGLDVLGAYVLFMGVASSLMVFLDAGIFSFAYPELIRLAHEGNARLFRSRLRWMLLQTLALSVAFAIASWIALPFLLKWIGNQVYKDAIGLYPWIVTATVINALGMVPHYALYARGFDRPIIYSHLAALPAFILSTWLVGMYQPALAVPIGLGVAFTVILAWKVIAYRQIGPDAGTPQLPATSL